MTHQQQNPHNKSWGQRGGYQRRAQVSDGHSAIAPRKSGIIDPRNGEEFDNRFIGRFASRTLDFLGEASRNGEMITPGLLYRNMQDPEKYDANDAFIGYGPNKKLIRIILTGPEVVLEGLGAMGAEIMVLPGAFRLVKKGLFKKEVIDGKEVDVPVESDERTPFKIYSIDVPITAMHEGKEIQTGFAYRFQYKNGYDGAPGKIQVC